MEAKQTYITPSIVHIQLDNEISLALESNPPTGPDEYGNNQLNKDCSDPYKTGLI